MHRCKYERPLVPLGREFHYIIIFGVSVTPWMGVVATVGRIGAMAPNFAGLEVMPKQAERQYKVGDKVSITYTPGRIVDRTVRAIIERTDGKQLQVDYERDQTVHPK